MKSKMEFTKLPLLFIVFLAVLGCSGSPSHQEIEVAVRKSLEHRVPPSLARYLLGGQNATVEEIKVIEVGKAYGEGLEKRWSVIIYARGSCEITFGGRQRFEGRAKYVVGKNLYEEWVATSSGL